MVFGAHQDALFIPWMSNYITNGEWQIYEYFRTLRDSQPGLREIIWLPNPPIPYFLLAIWIYLLKSIRLLDVSGWSYTVNGAWYLHLIPRTLFLVKSFYLILDILIWQILRSFVDRKFIHAVDLVWLFSPILLIPTYIMGQTDIISVFWVVLGLFFIKHFEQDNNSRWYFLASISLGLGAASKLWPLFLLPSMVIMYSRDSVKKFLFGFGAGLGAFLLPLLPYLPNKAFREWVLFGHGTGFLGGVSDNWIQSHVWFIILWTVFHILLFFISHKWKFQDLWVAWLLILILFFAVNPLWEFYWLLWVLPMVALAVTVNLNIWWLYLGTLVYYLFYIIVGWDFGIEIFMNGISKMAATGPRPRSVFFSSFDPMVKVTSISYSFFAGLLIGIAVIVLLTVRHKYQLRNKEKFNIIEQVSIFIIWGSYFIFLFWVGLGLGGVSMGDFIASYGATISQDRYFFLIILCLAIILIGLLLKPKRLKRKQ